MSTLTGRDTATRFATLPRVNLLPPEIEQQRRLKQVQAGLGVGVLATVGVVGALFLVASGQVSEAQDQLDASTQRGSALQAKTDEFAEVPRVYAQVEAGEARLEQAMGKEIRYSFFLNDLSIRTPDKVWLSKLTVTQTVNEAAASTVTADSYLTPGIGSVVVEGYGLAHNNVAAWLDALAKQQGLNQPYFTKSEVEEIGTEEVVKFVSQASLTEDALSGQYTRKAGS